MQEIETTMPVMCPIHPTPLPSELRLVRRGLGWRDREKRRGNKELRKRQEEEKKILNSNYYPPELIYVPSHKKQPPTVVNDLISAPKNS